MQGNVTTPEVRAYIRQSNKSVTELAEELGLSPTTIRRWRGRNAAKDQPCGANNSALAGSPSLTDKRVASGLRAQEGFSPDVIADVTRRRVLDRDADARDQVDAAAGTLGHSAPPQRGFDRARNDQRRRYARTRVIPLPAPKLVESIAQEAGDATMDREFTRDRIDLGESSMPRTDDAPAPEPPARRDDASGDAREEVARRPARSLGRYALALWLLGAVVYAASTQAFVRAGEMFRQQDQSAPAPKPASATGGKTARANATAAVATSEEKAKAAPAKQSTAAPVTVVNALDDGDWVEVARSDVNLRAGPSSSARVVTVQALGAKLRLVSQDGGWSEVLDPHTGQKGWIFGKYVKPADKGGVASPDVPGMQSHSPF